MDEPTPQKLPPWVKKEILLPVIGVLLIGLIFGNYLVYRAIKKERGIASMEYGPMDRHPFPGNPAPGRAIVDTGREFTETNGIVRFDATDFTRMTGAWRVAKDGDRSVVRMNETEGRTPEGRIMYLSYRIRFTTPGHYRLWGLMRSNGTGTTGDVQVFWNREPGGKSPADYELKLGSTNYVWSEAFKILPPPAPNSERPKNRDFAENGFPVEKPGSYTLYIATGEETHAPDRAVGTDADFFSFDRFVLKNAEHGDRPPR